jgi:cytochrome P450
VGRLTDEGFVMIVAGAETTARTLQNLIFFIFSNPDWLDRIREELDAITPDPQISATWQQLEALPCLVGSIKSFLHHANLVRLLQSKKLFDYLHWLQTVCK